MLAIITQAGEPKAWKLAMAPGCRGVPHPQAVLLLLLEIGQDMVYHTLLCPKVDHISLAYHISICTKGKQVIPVLLYE